MIENRIYWNENKVENKVHTFQILYNQQSTRQLKNWVKFIVQLKTWSTKVESRDINVQ